MILSMLIRALTQNDIPAWLALAHEGDEMVRGILPDIATFYEGFDEYIESKIKQHEAFMATDRMSGKCLGIVAFSQKHNRITFLGVAQDIDFQKTGRKLMEVALNQLDKTKEITVDVLKSEADIFKKERNLYELFGFTASGKTVSEAGVPARQMKRAAMGEKGGYSFHHDYPGYLEWMNEKKCPLCNNEPVWSDHDLIKELKYSSVHASMKAQGRLWGKCVVLCKKHFVELHDMPSKDLIEFMTDVQKTAKALKEVSGAVKINLEQHGNTIPHLHIHLFPRYLDDLYAGKAIDYTKTEPSPYESKAEYDYFIEQMREKLSVS